MAVGAVYGVAKEAKVISIKVWDDPNIGRASDIHSAVEWIVDNAHRTERPSIVNLNFSGGPNFTLNLAISAAIGTGIHFVGGAGNGRQVASGSPVGGESCLESVNFQSLILH